MATRDDEVLAYIDAKLSEVTFPGVAMARLRMMVPRPSRPAQELRYTTAIDDDETFLSLIDARLDRAFNPCFGAEEVMRLRTLIPSDVIAK